MFVARDFSCSSNPYSLPHWVVKSIAACLQNPFNMCFPSTESGSSTLKESQLQTQQGYSFSVISNPVLTVAVWLVDLFLELTHIEEW